MNQGLTFPVARLPGQVNFVVGQVKKLTSGPTGQVKISSPTFFERQVFILASACLARGRAKPFGVSLSVQSVELHNLLLHYLHQAESAHVIGWPTSLEPIRKKVQNSSGNEAVCSLQQWWNRRHCLASFQLHRSVKNEPWSAKEKAKKIKEQKLSYEQDRERIFLPQWKEEFPWVAFDDETVNQYADGLWLLHIHS